MEHLNITFSEDLKGALDREAKRERTKRSTLIQKAVRFYLTLKKRKLTMALLEEGYKEVATESRRIMKEFEPIDFETLENL